MISKKFIIFPIILGTSSVSIFLTSCAQVSQHEPRVLLNIDDSEFKVSVNGSTNNSPKYSTLIGSQLRVQKQNTDGKWEDANVKDEIYFLPLSINVVYPLVNLANKLINVSHVPSEFGKPDSLFSNNLIFDQNTNLKEFLYASSNTLNQGRNSQIKLYLSQMNMKSISTDSSKKLINDRTSDTTLVVEKKDIKISKDDKKDLWIYDISTKMPKKIEDNQYTDGTYTLPYSNKAFEEGKNKKFDLSFKYEYFEPEDTNIYKKPISDLQKIKDYVKNNNAWNGLEPTQSNFEVKLNIQVELRAEYSFSNYLLIDKGKELTEEEKSKLVAVTKVQTTTPYNTATNNDKYNITLPKKDQSSNDKEKKEYVNFSNFGVQFTPINNKSNAFLEDLKTNAGTGSEFKDNSSTLLSWTKEDKLPTSFYITSIHQQNELVEKIKKFKSTLYL